MPLLFNLRHLEQKDIHLEGEMSAEELEIDALDELIRVAQPLRYKLGVQKLDESVLVQGQLSLTFECQCARCLKPFPHCLELKAWTCHLPLHGEEQVIVANDCVDLTPYVREDILLEFPQHPLCKPECGGLPKKLVGKEKRADRPEQTEESSSAWAELNKLKF